MRRKGGLGRCGALLAAALLLAMGGPAPAAITPYPSDADTAVLYHLDEAPGTKSSHAADYVISDVDGNVTLQTNVDVSPFDGTPGPDGLSTAITSWAMWKRSFRQSGADTSIFSTTQFTVEAWIRDPGTLSGLDTGLNTIFRVASGGDIQFAVETISNEKKLLLRYNNLGGTTTLYSDALTVEAQTWYHAAVTYDDNGAGTPGDSTVTFYFTSEIDFDSGATQVGQAADTEDLEPFGITGILSIGEELDSNNFNGYLDEVRYSNVVRFGGVVPDPVGLELIGMVLLALRKGRA